MGFRVTRPEVLNNLVRFKDSLAELREKRERDQEQGQSEDQRKRKYKVLFNRKTGDMRFIQKITVLEERISRREAKDESLEDFTEVELLVTQSDDQSTQFEVLEKESGQNIDPIAKRIAKETLDVLNQKVKENPPTSGLLPEEEVLRDLSSIEIVSETKDIATFAGWVGKIDRMEAESRLEEQPVGTYLIREGGDEIAQEISFHLHKENHLLVRPYLLTVVEGKEKISDILILETEKGWCCYLDDPNLNDAELYQYHTSFQQLLASLSAIAARPLSP